ncbi:hypothetical protein WG66_014176 [Moniliophthora roreri]|nr:hypothetical protein WG66_014176 [Moniliophthora roreri]
MPRADIDIDLDDTSRILASYILDFLRSGSPPNEEISSLVKSVLEDMEERMAKYEEDLRNLQAKMRILQWKRDSLRSLYAPVRRLPAEVLSNIFILCKGENLVTSSGYRRSTTVVVASVCTRWRRVSVSTPQIWTRIAVSWASERGIPQFLLERLKLHLKRSCQVPLSLHLQITHCNAKHSALFSLLREHAGRLRTLLIRGYNRDVVRMIRSFDGRLSSVRDLNVIAYPISADESGVENNFLPLIHDNMPHLCSLSLRGVVRPVSSINALFSILRLSHISIALPVRTAMLVLDSCRESLVSAQITVISPDGPTVVTRDEHQSTIQKRLSPATTYRLSSLRSLSISIQVDNDNAASTLENAQSIMDALITPSLSSLTVATDIVGRGYTVSGGKEENTPFLTSLSKFLRRGFMHRSLRRLHLKALPLTEVGLMSLLGITDGVTDLTIEEIYRSSLENWIVTSKLLKALTIPEASVWLGSTTRHYLPKLRNLTLKVNTGDWSDRCFEKMLESRMTSESSLASVHLHVTAFAQNMDIDRLRSFQEMGLAVRVKHGVRPLEESDQNGQYLLGYEVEGK